MATMAPSTPVVEALSNANSTIAISTSATTVTTINSTESENITITTEQQTTNSTHVTQTDLPITTTNTTEGGKPSVDDSSNAGAIVGGVIGGIVVLAIIVVIVYFIRKRRNSRDSNVPVAPGKDFIDTIDMERAIHHHKTTLPEADTEVDQGYINVKQNGESNENTDPALAPDGYLKTRRYNFMKKKQKKDKEGAKKANKKRKERVTSMPQDHAPPVPSYKKERENSYADGRVADVSDEQNGENNSKSVYVNVEKDKINNLRQVQGGKADVTKNKKRRDNKDVKELGHDSPTINEDEPNDYINVDKSQYYNVKRGNQTKEPVRESTYENVENKISDPVEQDDVYEIP